MSRLFVAIFPPEHTLQALHEALPGNAHLTARAKWHLTLVFLGEAPAAAVSTVLAEIPSPGPVELALAGGGQFGAAAWSGVAGDVARLTELRSGVRDALTLAGFPSDERPFRPHLTVSYHADEAIRLALASYQGAPWLATEFALVSSSEGRYERLASWPL